MIYAYALLYMYLSPLSLYIARYMCITIIVYAYAYLRAYSRHASRGGRMYKIRRETICKESTSFF